MFSSNCRAARAVWGVGWGLVALLGLSQPAVAQFNTILSDVQIQTKDSPKLRFHQLPVVLGVKPQYRWDMTANEKSMTLTDFNTDTDPLVVESGTSSNTLYLARGTSATSPLGDVGIGTSTPRFVSIPGSVPTIGGRNLTLKSSSGKARLIVVSNTTAETFMVHNEAAVGEKIIRTTFSNGRYFISSVPDTNAGVVDPYLFSIRLSTGNIGFRTISPVHPFQVSASGAGHGNGAHLTEGGVWNSASSRITKQDIEQLTTVQARQTVRALEPVTFRYKAELDEQYVGFIAEDVPDLVATHDRKSLAPMDIVAVLTKVVQDQDLQLDEQRQLIEKQQALLDALNTRLNRLEQR